MEVLPTHLPIQEEGSITRRALEGDALELALFGKRTFTEVDIFLLSESSTHTTLDLN